MQPQQVDELLGQYRQLKARYEHLQMELPRMERSYQAEAHQAIDHASIHAQQYSDMPHGTDVVRQVETLAIKYADGFVPDEVLGWKDEVDQYRNELGDLQEIIRCVENWLEALSVRERRVVMLQRIDGRTWSELESESEKLFGFHMSAGGLRKIKRKAMQKIYLVAK